MSKLIKFVNTMVGIDLEIPKPAEKHLPNWYKQTESYVDGKKHPLGQGETSATIKKCVPVFDAITSGYIITSPIDIFVSQRDGDPFYEWPSGPPLGFHPLIQAEKHPNNNGHLNYPKWLNPWSISTPPGYSSLFVQPFHRESIFTILPGIVDTDVYHNPINFPFVLNDIKFEGLIPVGTPIAQVIPIKRESWQRKEEDLLQNKMEKSMNEISRVFFDGYRSKFWNKKQYK